jgi:hypothetical protein
MTTIRTTFAIVTLLTAASATACGTASTERDDGTVASTFHVTDPAGLLDFEVEMTFASSVPAEVVDAVAAGMEIMPAGRGGLPDGVDMFPAELLPLDGSALLAGLTTRHRDCGHGLICLAVRVKAPAARVPPGEYGFRVVLPGGRVAEGGTRGTIALDMDEVRRAVVERAGGSR